MKEILCSIHNYSKFTSGKLSYYDIAQEALRCGIDAVFLTDKNIYINGHDQYYYHSLQKVLLISGEEIFDPMAEHSPHCIYLGKEKEMFNTTPSHSRNEIQIQIADSYNPPDPSAKYFEILNTQDVLQKGFFDYEEILQRRLQDYDRQLLQDRALTLTAGSCASLEQNHPPYEQLFSSANNHLYLEEDLSGNPEMDKELIYEAIRRGRIVLAFDGIADSRGFSFLAQGETPQDIVYPGETIRLRTSVTLKIKSPQPCRCRLIHNGEIIREWVNRQSIPFTLYESGFYRVECAIARNGRYLSWIITNPIYVRRG